MNHELHDDAKIEFSNNECDIEPDLCNAEIFDNCLKEVFDLNLN